MCHGGMLNGGKGLFLDTLKAVSPKKSTTQP